MTKGKEASDTIEFKSASMKNIIILGFLFISINVCAQKTIITEIKLKNGYTVRGNIIDSIPNKSYTIKTLKGIEQKYSLAEIERISTIDNRSNFEKNRSNFEKLSKKGKRGVLQAFDFLGNNLILGLDLGMPFNYEGYYQGNYPSHKDNYNISYGLSLTFTLSKNIESSFNLTNKKLVFGSPISHPLSKVNCNLVQIGLSLNRFFLGKIIRPFIGIEGGNVLIETYSYEVPYGQIDYKKSSLYISPNLGVNFKLRNKFDISLVYKPLFVSEFGDFGDISSFIDRLNDGFLTVGIRYSFGNRK
jgi:hypothetical protein